MKKSSPPNKSPLFKILGDAMGNGGAGETGDGNLHLDGIGCTANVILIDN